MSQRLTLKNLRYAPDGVTPSRLSVMAGVCPTDARLTQWINSFQERALSEGRWWGTTQLAKFCISSGCAITLPREVAVVEAANLNGSPMRMGNMWSSFVRPHAPCGSLYGSCGCGCGCNSNFTMEENNTAASFATTTGSNKKIRVYPRNVADVGKKVTIQGYDSDGVWVRTLIDGIVQDGERVTLAFPFVDTTTVWGPGAPVNVEKELTSYRVLMYSLNTDDATEIQLADYGPTETNPMYRVVSIPGFRQSSTSGCTTSTLSAIVSLQHIPVVADTDFLLFQNMAAYQAGVLSEKFIEEGDFGKADAYFYGRQVPSKANRSGARIISQGGAIPMLQAEARKMSGDSTVVNISQATTDLAYFV